MSFHLGKPILVMLIVATATGAAIFLRPAREERADLVLWVFAEPHAQTYRGSPDPSQPSLVESFRHKTGLTTDIQLIGDRAENVRLVSIFMSGMKGPTVPDLVEVEISAVGKYFRPPDEDVGFLPLNRYLETSGIREIPSLDAPGRPGWKARLTTDRQTYRFTDGKWHPAPGEAPDTWADRIIHSRFAPWSKGDVIYGIPHDVHPVAIAYRHDLFQEAGIDLLKETSNPARPLTWPRFQELCLQFKDYWAKRGFRGRHPIELRTSGVDDLVVLLLQRHLNLIDRKNQIQFTDPRFVQTVAFFAQMVAGPRRIGGQSGAGDAPVSQDLNAGNICAYVAPDWRIRFIKDWTAVDAAGNKTLAGKMRVIPLPIFEPGDSRTATWGGTMIAITRACPKPDDAWKLIEHLYLSDEGFEARLRDTNILPPVIDQWDDPRFNRPDPFFGGQKVDALYAQLARELPERYMKPETRIAASVLTVVLHRAIGHVNQHGAAGLEQACAAWLKQAADELDHRIQWGKFE